MVFTCLNLEHCCTGFKSFSLQSIYMHKNDKTYHQGVECGAQGKDEGLLRVEQFSRVLTLGIVHVVQLLRQRGVVVDVRLAVGLFYLQHRLRAVHTHSVHVLGLLIELKNTT